ncbi:MAG: DNA mismatch repair protein MutS [Anaerolineae bacterium]|nr:DNA mismatch repair protein MutS [Gemmatimonadaceae bacterium]
MPLIPSGLPLLAELSPAFAIPDAPSNSVTTPVMQQYRDIKSRHQDAILLFRMGDFYETFFDDAILASKVLGITLTSRNNGGAAEVPLAGVPAKAVGEYMRRLVQKGYRVAICEQMEDPRLAKGIVRREVVETLTPGAVFSDDMLDQARNNFICALDFARDAAGILRVGVAAADLSTGEFRLAITSEGDLDAVLARFSPSEILVRKDAPAARIACAARGDENAIVTERDAWEFDVRLGQETLAKQFGVADLAGFGVNEGDSVSLGAAGALLHYLRELQPSGLPHLAPPVVERPGHAMPLDEMTRRNLELTESLRGGDTAGTLLSVLDRTVTPMGARLLRQWILMPLVTRTAIEDRLDAVAALAGDAIARAALRTSLDGVRDVERLASKAAAGRATPRELGALAESLARLPAVCQAAQRVAGAGAIAGVTARWDGCDDLCVALRRSLVDRPPVMVGDEPVIRPGIDSRLDESRALRDGGKDGIARIQAEERARTGIPSLKVGYNKVFGYFISVTNSNRHLVPAEYQRRQTLAGEERYVTPELKDYEERVLSAAEEIEARERTLFEELRARAGAEITRLQCIAAAIAQLDVLSSLAEVSEREGYSRPELADDSSLEIVAGRHPVVERMMPREKFIPNDVTLNDATRMIILTGPNMGGKSTILRQVGLIVLMAQMGSFVPASRARVGICDRVFTRVGASDNLVRGQSTFMVEMTETSAILNTATRRSLVLLDEIGRGTATYDGVSIAWAVSEHLHNTIACKTMFATHYHELTQLADELDAVRNYNVAVRETGDRILFLHTLRPGGADRSYGIEVGRLAGLPTGVLKRARGVLKLLEGGHLVQLPGTARQSQDSQLALFGAAHPVVAKLAELDVNNLTPIQALETLARLVDDARG